MTFTISPIKALVRAAMRRVAQVINSLTGGRVTPNQVTWFGLAMHVPVTLAIASGHTVLGGVLLIIFGLFDTVDGELARLQGRVSNVGGFLDASTDRFKEVLLYAGAAWLLAGGEQPRWAVLAVAACGASICVSFVKAKGEAVVAASRQQIAYPELNRMFSGGLFPFEVRMTLLAAGLLGGQLVWAVGIIALFSSVTAVQRLVVIARRIA